jgi:RNA polymerase sigma-70 factor (ECF subfamily)
MLRRTLGPTAEVEGLLQEVFVRALRQLAGLPESAQLKPFVVAVTVRTLSRELKRRRMQRLLRLRRERQAGDAPGSGSPVAQSALASLYRILDQLDPDARLAFTLRHFEGLQLPEVASAMDASLASAKRRLASANARVQAAVRRDAALIAYTTAAGLGDAP